jgi:hypothetical protein
MRRDGEHVPRRDDLRVDAERALDARLPLEEREVRLRLRDHQTTMAADPQVGVELRLEGRPDARGLRVEAVRGVDVLALRVGQVAPVVVEPEVLPRHLDVERARIRPRGFAIELPALHQRDVDAAPREVVERRAAQHAPADHQDVGAIEELRRRHVPPRPRPLRTPR